MSSRLSSIPSKRLRFFDIGVNATDPQFRGIYRDKQKHPSDFADVWARSKAVGCDKWLITGGDLADSREALQLALTEDTYPSTEEDLARRGDGVSWMITAGVHPTRSTELDSDSEAYLASLKTLITDNSRGSAGGVTRIRAYGEFGLDYDRFNYAPKSSQVPAFTSQLSLAASLDLPLFLHSRGPPTAPLDASDPSPANSFSSLSAPDAFHALTTPYLQSGKFPRRGVVHSFTGTVSELETLLDDGWSIGVNGCSLKTDANIDAVRRIPLHQLMLETDSPWCDMRGTHASAPFLACFATWYASYATRHALPPWPRDARKVDKFEAGEMVRGRNEPCMILRVAYVVAAIKDISVEELADQVWINTCRMFD